MLWPRIPCLGCVLIKSHWTLDQADGKGGRLEAAGSECNNLGTSWVLSQRFGLLIMAGALVLGTG